jgi:hypothetical protein
MHSLSLFDSQFSIFIIVFEFYRLAVMWPQSNSRSKPQINELQTESVSFHKILYFHYLRVVQQVS